MKACMPLVGLFLDPNASRNAEVIEEVLPPGSYRAVLREEWGDFVEQGNGQ
jgi:archaeosine-15-forming tRNA-guanine transglycosylase